MDYVKIVKYFTDLLLPETKYEITKEVEENNITVIVKVDKKDMGKLIGKNGNIITSLRTLINSLSNKDNKKVKILVKEDSVSR